MAAGSPYLNRLKRRVHFSPGPVRDAETDSEQPQIADREPVDYHQPAHYAVDARGLLAEHARRVAGRRFRCRSRYPEPHRQSGAQTSAQPRRPPRRRTALSCCLRAPHRTGTQPDAQLRRPLRVGGRRLRCRFHLLVHTYCSCTVSYATPAAMRSAVRRLPAASSPGAGNGRPRTGIYATALRSRQARPGLPLGVGVWPRLVQQGLESQGRADFGCNFAARGREFQGRPATVDSSQPLGKISPSIGMTRTKSLAGCFTFKTGAAGPPGASARCSRYSRKNAGETSVMNSRSKSSTPRTSIRRLRARGDGGCACRSSAWKDGRGENPQRRASSFWDMPRRSSSFMG